MEMAGKGQIVESVENPFHQLYLSKSRCLVADVEAESESPLAHRQLIQHFERERIAGAAESLTQQSERYVALQQCLLSD